MKCPTCGYEPTLKEIQATPDKCASCGASHAGVAQKAGAQDVRHRAPKEKGARKYLLAGFVSLLIAVAVCVYGVREYSHRQLVGNVDAVVRKANAQIAELLDEKANRTNADFLRIYQARMDGFDALVAEALAINDSASPGLAAATADYVRASRQLLKVFGSEVNSRINMRLKESAYESAKAYLSDDLVSSFIRLSDDQVNKLLSESVDRVSSEGDLLKGLDLLKQATIYEGLAKKRRAYLDAEAEASEAKAAHEAALNDLAKAGEEVKRVGVTLEGIAGEKLPIQSLEFKS